MTNPHGRRIQSRRALAILTWATLVIVAWLLWYGQQKRIIRIQAWEPAALLLSAYTTFLAIFGWLLFSPGRKSSEESPGLFFGGMLTLLPPCFIAYNLMPAGSPLRPWLTIGVFMFGIIAIMSPLPAEVFAVPRDRRTYLQPLTNAYLSSLDVDNPETSFDTIVPQTRFWLTRPQEEQPRKSPQIEGDPWSDPFYGTGRSLSRIGVSQSRRSDEQARSSDRRPQSEPHAETVRIPSLPVMPMPTARQLPELPTFRDTPHRDAVLRDQGSEPPVVSRPVGPSAEAPAFTASGSPARHMPAPGPAYRRPLTEPGQRPAAAGFQTPPIAKPGLPTSPAPPLMSERVSGDGGRSLSQLSPSVITSSGPVPPAPLPSSPISASSFATPLPTIPQRPLREITDEALSAAVTSVAMSHATTPSAVAPMVSSRLGSASTGSVADLNRRVPADEAADRQSDIENAGALSAESDPSTGFTRTLQQNGSDISLERIRDEHGGEMIEGTIHVLFEVGQKRAHLHIPFAPPLPGLPEVECEPTGDDPIRLKVAVRQPYGIRIEARRTEAAEALKAEVSFAAVYTPVQKRKT